MYTNYTNKQRTAKNKSGKLIFPQLSYTLVGVFFDVQNTLGRFSREKQYCDEIEQRLKSLSIPYKREVRYGSSGNIIDFLIDGKLIVEAKAKRVITKDDYYQTQRYLQLLKIKLGLLINFRNRYLKPIRVVRIDTDIRGKFV